MHVIDRNTKIRIEIAKIIGRENSLQLRSALINLTLIDRCKISIILVCKGRAYPGSTGQGLNYTV